MEPQMLPHNRQAEEAALGSVIMNPEVLPELYFLRPDDFYIHRNQWIWESFLRLQDRREAIDFVTVCNEIEKVGKLEEVGGSAYLTALIAQSAYSYNAAEYGKIVKDLSIRRGLIRSANGIAGLAYNVSMDIDAVRSESDDLITSALRYTDDAGGTLANAISSVYDDTQNNADKIKTGQPIDLGLSTGFIDIDRILMGIEPEELVYIAARPGQGKSTLLLNIALHNARQGKRVALFVMEASSKEVGRRLIAQVANIDSQKIKSGSLGELEWPRFTAAVEELDQLNIEICDATDLTPAKLRAKCLQLSRGDGLDLVVVDYIQLMSAGIRTGNRAEEIAYISRQLKILTKTLHAPILSAAQLNREIEKRQDRRPVLSDLKESGGLEQDANCVMFLYTDPNIPSDDYECIIAKRRDGMTGTAPLIFQKEFSKFKGAHTKVFRPNE